MDEFREEVKELQIGRTIRHFRQQQRLTLQDLSRETELSKPLLSQIENDQVIPPLATLLRIAKALKVPLQTFFEENDSSQKCQVVKAGQGSLQPRLSDHNAPLQPYAYHSLAFGRKHKHMEPFLVEFDPNPDVQPTPVQHPGEEFFYILEGSIELMHGGKKYLLEQGDSVYWDSKEPHCLKAVGGQVARGIAVLYPRN